MFLLNIIHWFQCYYKTSFLVYFRGSLLSGFACLPGLWRDPVQTDNPHYHADRPIRLPADNPYYKKGLSNLTDLFYKPLCYFVDTISSKSSSWFPRIPEFPDDRYRPHWQGYLHPIRMSMSQQITCLRQVSWLLLRGCWRPLGLHHWSSADRTQWLLKGWTGWGSYYKVGRFLAVNWDFERWFY